MDDKMRFEVNDSTLGQFKTLLISDNKTNSKIEIALRGATLLNYFVKINQELFHFIDGFQTPEELEFGKGARCWIMTPFANRIKNGLYNFLGNTYYLKPIPPRTQVIHGLTSNVNFKVLDINSSNEKIEIIFYTDILRPGIFDGYPFSVDVYIKYVFEGLKLNVEVIAKNVGNEPAPFGTGWHPYFKTSEKGIDNLILTINANQLIITDQNLIPLKDENAYGRIDDYPGCDFRETKTIVERVIKNRILDNCFADLKVDDIGLHSTSLHDTTNGIKISVFQRGGMTQVFSGDTLSGRERKSIAIEPVQFMTNAFNRPELVDKIKIAPGEESKFEFGLEVSFEGN
jgi:aldose 1-epimerase